jgi:hypothetical protein
MVNNFTIINKINNHLSPQTIERKKTTAYDFRNPDPGLVQAQKCGGVKPVSRILYTHLVV